MATELAKASNLGQTAKNIMMAPGNKANFMAKELFTMKTATNMLAIQKMAKDMAKASTLGQTA